MVNIDEMLVSARSRLRRVDAQQAYALQRAGAVLVDIRPQHLRERDGLIPGALVIERTKLEWRCDPAAPWHVPELDRYDVAVVVVCEEGYSSSLAAASLQDLGLTQATDLIDGFRGWARAGLPVQQDPGSDSQASIH